MITTNVAPTMSALLRLAVRYLGYLVGVYLMGLSPVGCSSFVVLGRGGARGAGNL